MMNFTLSEAVNRKKAFTLILVLTVISAALCVLFGELTLPLLAGFYAVLVLLDSSNKKIVCTVLGSVFCAATVLLYCFELGTMALAFGTFGGVIIAVMFVKGVSKGELAFYLIAVFTLMSVGSIYLYFASLAGDFSPSAVTECAKAWYIELRDGFADEVMNAVMEYPNEIFEGVSAQSIAQIFDSAFNLTFSVIIIGAFVLAGVSLKLFSSIAYRLVKEQQRIVYWRFATSNVVAYFYCALLVLNFFLNDGGVLAITVANMFYVFMAVYAYIGYNFALSIIAGRLGYSLSVIIVIAGVIMLGIFGVEVLSIFGVVFTHISNRVGWHIDSNKQ